MKRFKLAEINDGDLLYVARNMREWDKREIYATRATDDPNAIVDTILHLGGKFAWLAGAEKPIAAFGAFCLWPGAWTVWCFGTDDFGQIGKDLTRFLVRRIMPALAEQGAHRAECRSIEGHTEAHEWLERMGAVREATLLDFGRNRETFHVYAWRQTDAEADARADPAALRARPLLFSAGRKR